MDAGDLQAQADQFTGSLPSILHLEHRDLQPMLRMLVDSGQWGRASEGERTRLLGELLAHLHRNIGMDYGEIISELCGAHPEMEG